MKSRILSKRLFLPSSKNVDDLSHLVFITAERKTTYNSNHNPKFTDPIFARILHDICRENIFPLTANAPALPPPTPVVFQLRLQAFLTPLPGSQTADRMFNVPRTCASIYSSKVGG